MEDNELRETESKEEDKADLEELETLTAELPVDEREEASEEELEEEDTVPKNNRRGGACCKKAKGSR